MSEHLKIALQLSPQELRWLSELPYYIRSADLGTLFVHAGFQQGVKLQHQDPWVGSDRYHPSLIIIIIIHHHQHHYHHHHHHHHEEVINADCDK